MKKKLISFTLLLSLTCAAAASTDGYISHANQSNEEYNHFIFEEMHEKINRFSRDLKHLVYGDSFLIFIT